MHAAAVNGKLAKSFFNNLYKVANYMFTIDDNKADIYAVSMAGFEMDGGTKDILGFCCGEPWTLESAKARRGVSRT
jgi:hypothetical protein